MVGGESARTRVEEVMSALVAYWGKEGRAYGGWEFLCVSLIVTSLYYARSGQST